MNTATKEPQALQQGYGRGQERTATASAGPVRPSIGAGGRDSKYSCKVDIIVVTGNRESITAKCAIIGMGPRTWACDGNEADTWDRGSLRECVPGLASQWGRHL